ncbi:MAG TPA: DciA family protein [Hyphomicrobium sp.]|nr:DciA family protein [Hyphomicrobium sp.]
MPTPKEPHAFRPLPPDRRTTTKGVFAKAVGSFVPKLAAKSFERYGFHSAEIMTAWPRVAGAEIAGFTAPERIKWPRGSGEPDGTGASGGATLVLRVEPARALDVEYRSAEIIDRINRYFGYRAVGTLKLIQAPLLKDGKTGFLPGVEAAGQAAGVAPIPATADGGLKAALETLWSSVVADRRGR